jgi:hypothetical protein
VGAHHDVGSYPSKQACQAPLRADRQGLPFSPHPHLASILMELQIG